MTWQPSNISVKRNAFCNDTKNDPIFDGWCKIDRVEYNLFLWFLLDKNKNKFLSGSVELKQGKIVKKGTIVLFQNKSKESDKQPSMSGSIILFDGNEEHKVTLWYKVIKDVKKFTGVTKFIEKQTVKPKENTKINFIEKIQNG